MDNAVKDAFAQQIGRIRAAGERLAQMDDASFLYEVQAAADVLTTGYSARAYLHVMAAPPSLAPCAAPGHRLQQKPTNAHGASVVLETAQQCSPSAFVWHTRASPEASETSPTVTQADADALA